MSNVPIDAELVPLPLCSKRNCPTNEKLISYPMLDEDLFDEVDEMLFNCATCKKRQERLNNSIVS